MAVVTAAFAPLAGKRILDVGCGTGALARSLSKEGALVVGVDPNEGALAAARRSVPAGTFLSGEAQALPLEENSFDGVVLLNSLHHVPEREMRPALLEAARVAKPGCPIVVVEPLAEGSFFSVLSLVEDETEVRAAAQEAVAQAMEDGAFEGLRRVDYPRREQFADVGEFLSRIVAVDPARAPVVEERREEIAASFRLHARTDPRGRSVLEQPMRAHVLVAKA